MAFTSARAEGSGSPRSRPRSAGSRSRSARMAERGVEHVADSAPQVVAGAGDRTAEDGDRTPVGPKHSEQEPHQRGLPSPVQADQRVNLAGNDL